MLKESDKLYWTGEANKAYNEVQQAIDKLASICAKHPAAVKLTKHRQAVLDKLIDVAE